jgi:acyl carrier protein
MDILLIIYEAIDDLNLDLNDEEKIEKSESTEIFGSNSRIDSMGLVNLITVIEEKLEEKTGKFISIADEKAMSLSSSPFKNVLSLKNYIEDLINGK